MNFILSLNLSLVMSKYTYILSQRRDSLAHQPAAGVSMKDYVEANHSYLNEMYPFLRWLSALQLSAHSSKDDEVFFEVLHS